ncbi:MAG: hypothetical protein IH590_13035, partial [Aquamicrobium sp.]|nr:hypothetical protein [Aquamicrobium sp.]
MTAPVPHGAALLERLSPSLSGIRGKLIPDAPMETITWFRAGGPAELLFQPADEDDLAAFLKALPQDVPVTIVGIGDSLNDLELLRAADRSVLVRKVTGRHDERIDIAGLVRTNGIGPAGWNEAV